MNIIRKIRNIKKQILNKEYFSFLILIFFIVFLISSALIFFNYKFYVNITQRNLSITATRIDSILNDIFDETNQLMIYIGKEIAKHENNDLKSIARLLQNLEGNEYKVRDILSWTLFDWIDSNNIQVVNQIKGVASNPPDMSNRSYTWKCRKHPWTLQLSQPVIGNPSGIWVIPAGTGIIDNKGSFLGIIVVGFNIINLVTAIEKRLVDNKANFIVLGEDFNIALQSSSNKVNFQNLDHPILTKSTKDISKVFKSTEGILSVPINHEGVSYHFYKKMTGYPYIIITGMHNSIYKKEFESLIFPRIIETFGMGLFSLAILYFFRKRMMTVIKTSNILKEDFIILTHKKMHLHLDSILEYSYFLLQFLKGNIEVGVNKERQIEFVSNIHQAALTMKTLATDKLELKPIDINTIIKILVAMHSKTAFQNNISIKMNLEQNLPVLYADEFKIKQIIIGLLLSSIDDCTPNGGNITILTNLKNAKHKKFLQLIIQDDGFGLDENDMIRISEKFGENKNSDFNLDFTSIMKLVRLHNGICQVKSKWGKGRIIIVSFPYQSFKPIE